MLVASFALSNFKLGVAKELVNAVIILVPS